MKRTLLLFLLGSLSSALSAQRDSLRQVVYRELVVKDTRANTGVGRLADEQADAIYAGRKSELISLDSSDGNKAVNNTRELIGRVAGLNVVETETGGFTANGIGLRGLNPVQSLEMNVRQNGYNIAGDVFGYNEVYYQPPSEAIERIELVRGGGSLQYGPQFGGMINYVTRSAPRDRKVEWQGAITGGSNGLINVFNSLGGTIHKLHYYGYVQYRYIDGYRPNSRSTQWVGYGHLGYQFSRKFEMSVEYSFLQNKIQMPGGLSDEQYQRSDRDSYRSRNWLTSPWNILSLNAHYQISPKTLATLAVSYGHKARKLIWKNEDGGANALDTFNIDLKSYNPRELEIEQIQNINAELRVMTHYAIRGVEQTLLAGIRGSYSQFHQQGGGEGTTGSDLNLTLVGAEFEYDLKFRNINIAPFIENIFRIGKRFTITPGLRLEYLRSTAMGYKEIDGTEVIANESKDRTVLLASLGLEYRTTSYSSIYADISRAYRPIDYSSLTPFGTSAVIDPKLKDAQGFNSELGYRGSWRGKINWDINGFLLLYQDRVGLILKTDENGREYSYRTNVANSLHLGLESYLELNLIKLIQPLSHAGNLNLFNSLAYNHARYITSEYRGKQVEYAPDIINRTGLSYNIKGFAVSLQLSYQSQAFGDASNALRSDDDPSVGRIPSYYVVDCSASYRIGRVGFSLGLNNLSNERYFTFRTPEYPGPGIIPSIGRNFYAGFNVRL